MDVTKWAARGSGPLPWESEEDFALIPWNPKNLACQAVPLVQGEVKTSKFCGEDFQKSSTARTRSVVDKSGFRSRVRSDIFNFP